MVFAALAFLGGILWVETRASLDSVAVAAPLLFLVVLICGYWRPKWLAMLALGALWAGLRAQSALDARAWDDGDREDRLVVGVVASIPENSTDRVQFDFEPQEGLPQRVRVSWYKESGAGDGAQMPRAAERWQLKLRLRSPRGFANPGGFDYEGQLFREGIGATGYVRRSEENRRIAHAGWRRPVLQLRAGIVERIESLLPDSVGRGILSGLAVGATHAIPTEQWRVFAATGITHLIAISGLHVTMIAALAMLLVRLLWRLRWTPRPRRCRSDIAALCGAAVATAYAALAGFSVPTQRTLIMFLVVLAAMWLRRAQPPSQRLALALLAVLILDPHAALAPGFWLSFIAVAAIFWSLGGAARERRPLFEFLSVQAAVTLALLPATLILFGSLSLVSPAVNLLAIPFFSFILVPGILLGVCLMAIVPAAGVALLQGMVKVYEWFLPFLQWAAELPAAFVHLPDPGLWLGAALILGAAILITPLPWRVRASGLLLAVPLAYASPGVPPPGGLQLTVLDVGQGLAVFVRTHSHALLYDAGPSFRSGRSTGDLVVLPFLWNAGVRRLDRMMISHSDNDHAGGAEAVKRGMEIEEAGKCERGEQWMWDGVHFEVLHPDQGESWSDNNSSCVLRIAGAGGSVLLMGDLEKKAEAYLLARGEVRKADVVVVPHHGSRSSSSEALVAALGARYAIVSAGHRNRWRFPHPQVIGRWCKSGADVPTTAEWGAVTLDIDPQTGPTEPRAYRLEHRRYWHSTSSAAGRSLCRSEERT